MKKILASLMALAMFVSVAVVMAGCGNVNGEYKYSHATYTVITKVDEETGKVTETKTYTEEEYFKICYVWSEIDHEKTAEEALEVELDEDQTKAYNEMLDARRKHIRRNIMFGDFEADEVSITLKNGKANLVGTILKDGVYTYEKEVLTIEGTYEVKEDKLYFKTLGLDGEGCYEGLEDYKMAGYDIQVLSVDLDNKTAMMTDYAYEADEDCTGLEFSPATAMTAIYRTDLVFVEA